MNFLLMKLSFVQVFDSSYVGLQRDKRVSFFNQKKLCRFCRVKLKMSHIFLFVKVEQKSFVTRETIRIGPLQNVMMTNDHQNCSSVSGNNRFFRFNLSIVCLSLLQYSSSFENPFSTPVSGITWLKSHLYDYWSAQVEEVEEILHADSKTRTSQLLIQGKQKARIKFYFQKESFSPYFQNLNLDSKVDFT